MRRRLGDLAERTSVHGVYEIYHAKSHFWLWTWILILTIATGITAYQMCLTGIKFYKQQTLTNLEPVKPGQAFYPGLSFCYQHWVYWADWEKIEKLGFSKYRFFSYIL